MSTLKATNLQNASAANPAIVLAADGSATAQLSSLNGGPLAGARNRIINGDMRIDQRNNGASATASAGAVTYFCDRWFVYTEGSTLAVQSVGGQTGVSTNILRLTGNAGNTASLIGQRIESLNCTDLAGETRTVILSWYAASSSKTSMSYRVTYANSTNDFGAVTLIATGSRAITSTLTRYSVSFVVPAQAFTGIQIEFIASSLTTGTFDITSVQLEPGTVATPFERRSYGQELALCQRYAFAWGLNGVQFVAAGTGGLYSDANSITMKPFGLDATQMRTVPSSITAVGTQGTDWAVQSSAGINQTGFTLVASSGVIATNKTSHGLSNNANIRILTANGRIIVSSEI